MHTFNSFYSIGILYNDFCPSLIIQLIDNKKIKFRINTFFFKFNKIHSIA